MPKGNDRYITVRIDPALYGKWQKHVERFHGCKRAGRTSKIMEINSEVFTEGIKREMGI